MNRLYGALGLVCVAGTFALGVYAGDAQARGLPGPVAGYVVAGVAVGLAGLGLARAGKKLPAPIPRLPVLLCRRILDYARGQCSRGELVEVAWAVETLATTEEKREGMGPARMDEVAARLDAREAQWKGVLA